MIARKAALGWEKDVGELLVLVLLHFVMEKFQLFSCLTEKFLALGTGVVLALANHTLNTAINDEHGTSATRRHTAIERGAIECYTSAGGLTNGILFSMNRADAMGGYGAVGIY